MNLVTVFKKIFYFLIGAFSGCGFLTLFQWLSKRGVRGRLVSEKAAAVGVIKDSAHSMNSVGFLNQPFVIIALMVVLLIGVGVLFWKKNRTMFLGYMTVFLILFLLVVNTTLAKLI